MTLFIAYLIYRSSLILNFLNQYIGSSEIVTGNDLTGNLFNFIMFVIPFLLIVASIIILSIMYMKKKPFLFYVISILIAVVIVVMYTVAYSTIGTMEIRIVDVKVIRMVRDILMMVFVLQCVSVVITFIRATGFDIRKFDFGADLAELDIQEEDNEEVEVELNIDTDKIQRKARRRLRYLKYAYVENKFMFHIGILIACSVVFFFIYFNLNIYSKSYKTEQTVLFTGYQFTLHNTYILREDELGNPIHKGKAYVVLKVSIRNTTSTPKKFPSTRAELVIDGKTFHHISTYYPKMQDIGVTYNEQKLDTKTETYLLAYEIPDTLSKSKMKLEYVDDITLTRGKMRPKYITFHLEPNDLSTVKTTKDYLLGEVMDLSDSIFLSSKLKIDQIEIEKTFKEEYQFCVTNSECYLSWEYVKPNLLNTYPKSLMKLKGNLVWASNLPEVHSTDLYQFIQQYGKVYYEINGATFQMNPSVEQVIPIKVKEENTYYIELTDDAAKASKLWILFHIRDRDYRYMLKG